MPHTSWSSEAVSSAYSPDFGLVIKSMRGDHTKVWEYKHIEGLFWWGGGEDKFVEKWCARLVRCSRRHACRFSVLPPPNQREGSTDTEERRAKSKRDTQREEGTQGGGRGEMQTDSQTKQNKPLQSGSYFAKKFKRNRNAGSSLLVRSTKQQDCGVLCLSVALLVHERPQE